MWSTATAVLLWATLLLHLSAEAKPCNPQCIKYGNCGEDGKCMCPFGRLGEACEIDFLAPCRFGPDHPVQCEASYPQSCECARRCREYSCPANSSAAPVCHWQLAMESNTGCFVREGVLPNEQYSLIPEDREAGVKYYAGPDVGAAEVDRRAALVSLGGTLEALPLSRCPASCNMRGHCTKVESSRPQCSCFRGFKGKKCEIEESTCYLNCNGRGRCLDTFCHCEPPYFSLGCSRSNASAQSASRPSPVDLRIYMYELPSQLAHDLSLGAGEVEEEHIHMAHHKFIEQFLLSPVRTENPEEANLFLVPAQSWSYGGNDLNVPHLDVIVDHIATNYPYWNRNRGRDHFMWLTNDRGACALSGAASSAIKLTHFGLHAPRNAVSWAPESILNQEYGCYHSLRDVVTPPHDFMAPSLLATSEQLSVDDIIKAKKSLMFFSGTVSSDVEYSGQTRQRLAELASSWNDKDIVFDAKGDTSPRKLEKRMREAKFCLSVYGYGFGMRLLTCMFSNSVPVIIQEHVFQPFEEVLPYEDFSLRLDNADLPHLPAILRSVTDAQYRTLLEGTVKYRGAFHWDTSRGGRAFDYTIAALRRKYMNAQALYY